MRPRKTENQNLPPRMYRRTRKRKYGKVWVAYYYRDAQGKDIPLGSDLDQARIKWAQLEAKEKPVDLLTMKGIFDCYPPRHHSEEGSPNAEGQLGRTEKAARAVR